MSSPDLPRSVLLTPSAQSPPSELALGMASSSPGGSVFRRIRGWLVSAGTDLFPLILLTIAYYAVGLIVGVVFGFSVNPQPETAAVMVLAMLAWLLLVILVITIPFLIVLYVLRMGYYRLGRTFPADIDGAVRFLLRPRAITTALLVFFLYSVFIAMFVAFKRGIPEVVPFRWDDAFMKLDRIVHFGHHPWRLLQPVLGTPDVTDLIDRIYYVWFPVNYLCITAFAWCEDRAMRVRFYLSFWLVWIVPGTMVAYALSSAGPCYFGFVTSGANPFTPLMDYLRQVDRSHDLIAVYVQRELWADYARGSANLVMKGISAMPSVHVALPVLYALAGWRVHRAIGIAFSAYAFVIFLGSIHLGWHYAVDGYVSVFLVVFLWWISGRFSRWYTGAFEAWEGRAGRPQDMI